MPADASVVLILGPRKPFHPAEIAALKRYLDKNGRLLIALDPDAGQTLPELLGPLSLEVPPDVTLANERIYLRDDLPGVGPDQHRRPNFSSHVSVTTNSRVGAPGRRCC